MFYTCTDSYTFYEFRFSRMVYMLYLYTLIHILWVPILRKGIYFIHVHTHTHSMSSDSPEGYMFYTCTHWYTFYEFRFSGRVYILYMYTLIHILWVPILRKGIYLIHVHTHTHSMSSDSPEGYIFYTCTHSYTFYEFRFSGRVYILYMYTLIHILWVPILRKGIYFIHVHTDTHSMSSDSPEGYIFYTCTHSYTFYEFRFSGRVYILYMYTLIHILWVPILRKGIYFIHVHTDTHSMSSDSPEGYMFYTCTHWCTFYEFRFSVRVYILYMYTLIHILWVPILRKGIYFIHVHTDTHSMSSDSPEGYIFYTCTHSYTFYEFRFSGRVYILYMYTLIHILWVPILRKGIYFIHVHTDTHSMSSDSPEGYMFYTCTHWCTFYEFRFSVRVYILYMYTLIHILWVPILRKGIYFIHVHTDTHSMSSDSPEGYIFYTCTHSYTFYEFRFSARVYVLYMYRLIHILWVPILPNGIYFIPVHTHTHSMSSDSPEGYIFYTCTHWYTFYEFRFSGRVYILYM